MKKYYVYKIQFNDGTYYIGYRGSKKIAKDDFLIKYKSSSKTVKEKIKYCEFKGEILIQNISKEEAYHLEQKLIFESINDVQCLNKVCYYGRDGFGILTESAKQKISETSRSRWEDNEYRNKLIQKQKGAWTDERKKQQSERLTGVKRPEHSKKLRGRALPEEVKVKLRKPKSIEHVLAVSNALKGIPKSEEHKKKLSGPKPRVCRLFDRKEMSVGHYTRWLNSLLPQEK